MTVSAQSPITPPSLFDAEIERRLDAVWAAEGYITHQGERDPKAMQDAAYRAVRGRIATSKTDKADKAITKGELYEAVFPSGPGANGNPEHDEFDERVHEQLERDVWSLTQPKESGALQKRLGEEGCTLVLLRATIRRPLDKAQAVYLTDNSTLIMEDSVDKEIKAYERKAANLRRQLDMIVSRHPELAPQIRTEISQGVNRTEAELSFPTNNGTPAGELPRTTS